MCAARINLKNIDYFKFKKLIIDGSRDDYNACSKEVKALCDNVQTVNFRDEEFDDESDRGRFTEICYYYKQILASKRIDSADMRIKSGWWGDHKNAYSAGKLKPAILKTLLLAKCQDWGIRNGLSEDQLKAMADKIDGPGLYVIKHKDHQCFQYVGRAERVFAKVAERLKAAFDGNWQEPLAALLIMSMVTDWDFYFTPVGDHDDERVLRIMENDVILKHDAIWPHGLNGRLHIDTLLEVSEFRKSCLRHHWPPEDVIDDREIDLVRLRRNLAAAAREKVPSDKPVATVAPAQPPPPWRGILDVDRDVDDELERPESAMSSTSTLLSNVTVSSNSTTSSSDSMMTQLTEIRIKKDKPSKSPGRPISGGRKKAPSSPRASKNLGPDTPTKGSGRKTPTTPSENGDGDTSSEADSNIDRTPSLTSLSSTGGEKTSGGEKTPRSAPDTPKKTKSSTPRPSSARSRAQADKSRLPVSGRK